jgi:transcriptional regulator of heat shock response
LSIEKRLNNDHFPSEHDNLKKKLQQNEGNLNEMTQYKQRMEELEKENEQLRREDIVHVESNSPTNVQTMLLPNEEHERLENEIQQLQTQLEQYKKTSEGDQVRLDDDLRAATTHTQRFRKITENSTAIITMRESIRLI